MIGKSLQQELDYLTPEQLEDVAAYVEQLIATKRQQLIHIVDSEADKPRKRSTRESTETYRQEYVKCGKPDCKCARGRGHGPYWYAYRREGSRTRKRYLGKNFKPPRN